MNSNRNRDIHLNALAQGADVVNVSFEKTVGREFKAHLEAMKEAGTVITICDPDDPQCERQAAITAVAEMLNSSFLLYVCYTSFYSFEATLYS